jgi:hypothetical protein
MDPEFAKSVYKTSVMALKTHNFTLISKQLKKLLKSVHKKRYQEKVRKFLQYFAGFEINIKN